MEKIRQNQRKRCSEILEFTVAVFNDNRLRIMDLSGLVVNISKEGICFVTRYPLKSGHVVKFKKSIGRYSHGVIIWIRDLGGHYMAGASLEGEVQIA